MLVSLWMGVIAAAWPMSMRMACRLPASSPHRHLLLRGVAFPQIAMPNGARLWSEILPLTSYLKLQSGLLGMGMPWPWSARPLLFGLSVLLLLLLAAKLRQRGAPNAREMGRAMKPHGFAAAFAGTLRSIITDKGVLLMLVVAPLIYSFFLPVAVQHGAGAESAGGDCGL